MDKIDLSRIKSSFVLTDFFISKDTFLLFMSSALANNDARPHLPDRHVSLTPRPCCAHCHHPMAIIKTAKLHLVGKEGNYTVFVEYY